MDTLKLKRNQHNRTLRRRRRSREEWKTEVTSLRKRARRTQLLSEISMNKPVATSSVRRSFRPWIEKQGIENQSNRYQQAISSGDRHKHGNKEYSSQEGTVHDERTPIVNNKTDKLSRSYLRLRNDKTLLRDEADNYSNEISSKSNYPSPLLFESNTFKYPEMKPQVQSFNGIDEETCSQENQFCRKPSPYDPFLGTFTVPCEKPQYFALVEGIATGKEIQSRSNYFVDVRFELMSTSNDTVIFPSSGIVTELLPVALEPGEWQAKVVDDRSNPVVKTSENRENCYRQGLLGKTIRIRHKDFETITCKHLSGTDSNRNSQQFHCSEYNPSFKRSEALQNHNVCQQLETLDDEHGCSGSGSFVSFVGCVSVVVFDGFDTNSEARDLGDSIIHSVLQETKQELSKIVCNKETDSKCASLSQTLVCVLPCTNESKAHDSMPISGGLSAIVDYGIEFLDDNNCLEQGPYHLILTTCERSRKVIGVDVVFTKRKTSDRCFDSFGPPKGLVQANLGSSCYLNEENLSRNQPKDSEYEAVEIFFQANKNVLDYKMSEVENKPATSSLFFHSPGTLSTNERKISPKEYLPQSSSLSVRTTNYSNNDLTAHKPLSCKSIMITALTEGPQSHSQDLAFQNSNNATIFFDDEQQQFEFFDDAKMEDVSSIEKKRMIPDSCDMVNAQIGRSRRRCCKDPVLQSLNEVTNFFEGENNQFEDARMEDVASIDTKRLIPGSCESSIVTAFFDRPQTRSKDPALQSLNFFDDEHLQFEILEEGKMEEALSIENKRLIPGPCESFMETALVDIPRSRSKDPALQCLKNVTNLVDNERLQLETFGDLKSQVVINTEDSLSIEKKRFIPRSSVGFVGDVMIERPRSHTKVQALQRSKNFTNIFDEDDHQFEDTLSTEKERLIGKMPLIDFSHMKQRQSSVRHVADALDERKLSLKDKHYTKPEHGTILYNHPDEELKELITQNNAFESTPNREYKKAIETSDKHRAKSLQIVESMDEINNIHTAFQNCEFPSNGDVFRRDRMLDIASDPNDQNGGLKSGAEGDQGFGCNSFVLCFHSTFFGIHDEFAYEEISQSDLDLLKLRFKEQDILEENISDSDLCHVLFGGLVVYQDQEANVGECDTDVNLPLLFMLWFAFSFCWLSVLFRLLHTLVEMSENASTVKGD